MKIVLGIVVVLVIIAAAVLLFSPKAPQDVQQAVVGDAPAAEQATTTEAAMVDAGVEITSFNFTGYGPGKSHLGTFEQYEVSNVAVDANGLPTAGTVTFYVDSIKTDAAMLDTHLKEKKEFFESATYPTVTFKLASVADKGNGMYDVTGDLTVKNVTKRITFGVTAAADKTFSSEFRVAMDQFGFTAPGIVDNEVLVKFSGKAQ
ncbi:MAG: hypothetical protein RL150_369 [Candidatus Parcubacteria bacterium]|jgi:polyisoprenoid-binding protein YceI